MASTVTAERNDMAATKIMESTTMSANQQHVMSNLSTPAVNAVPNEETLASIQSQLDALEQMRWGNLEVEFSCNPSGCHVDHGRCTFCQREELKRALTRAASPDIAGNVNGNRIGAKLRELKIDGHRIRSLDGRRLRNFSKRFLSKSTTALDDAADQSDSVSQSSRKDDAQSKLHLAESCPARLDEQEASKSSSTTINQHKSHKNILKRPASSCLTCGHPTCNRHISNTFSTYHIQICQQCAYLFEFDFLVDVIACATNKQKVDCKTAAHDDLTDANDVISNMQQYQQKVNAMIDCYNRAKLLLSYTAQYTPTIIDGLQSRMDKSNKIGIGANASGIVSGITGVIGAGALLCPPVAAAGVPILIASLVFGGGATVAHSGDYATVKYLSEPNMLADKMVVLHGMCFTMLRVVEVLSYGLLSRSELNDENIDCSDDAVDGEKEKLSIKKKPIDKHQVVDTRQEIANDIRSLLEKHGVNTTMGKDAISSSTAITGSNVANRSSRFVGRIRTTAAASFCFVPLAGGVLSAASLVVEANEIQATLNRLNEGSPCEKSEQITEIAGDVDRLPDAAVIAEECRQVFEEAEKQMQQKSGATSTV